MDAHTVVAKLSPPPAIPKGLDDLELVDGWLLVTAIGTEASGRIMRVRITDG